MTEEDLEAVQLRVVTPHQTPHRVPFRPIPEPGQTTVRFYTLLVTSWALATSASMLAVFYSTTLSSDSSHMFET